ncbi:general stress protein [Virgibacillus kimchii]
MSNEIFGPYETTDEVINMVTSLELKGYKSSNISLLANEDHTENLIKHTDVNVESEVSGEPEKHKFTKKVQNLFSNSKNVHTSLHERLKKENISDKQADKLLEAVENGKIVILADNELKMGNDSTPNAVSMKEDTIQRD